MGFLWAQVLRYAMIPRVRDISALPACARCGQQIAPGVPVHVRHDGARRLFENASQCGADAQAETPTATETDRAGAGSGSLTSTPASDNRDVASASIRSSQRPPTSPKTYRTGSSNRSRGRTARSKDAP